MINVTFGQENLQQVVTEECLQNKDFPLPSADGFNKMQACRSLVEDLTKLSNQEWKTGSRKGYFNFCASYVRNKDEDGGQHNYTKRPCAEVRSAEDDQQVAGTKMQVRNVQPGLVLEGLELQATKSN